MVIVLVDPVVEGFGSLAVCGPGGGVGPFGGEGPLEPFDFAVGLGTVRPDADMVDVDCFEGVTEDSGGVSGSVVGHDRLDHDPLLGEPLTCPLYESDTGVSLFVWTEL